MSSGATPSPSPQAGWYPDPLDPASERLWDGERWLSQTRPVTTGSAPAPGPLRPSPAPGPPSAAPNRKRSGSGWSTGSMVGIGCGLVALLSVGGCVVLVGVVPLIAVRSQEVVVDEAPEFAVAAPEPSMVPVPTVEEGPDGLSTDSVVPPAVFGSSAEVVAVLAGGEAAAFEITVEDPVDVTEPVLAGGGLDTEPPDGEVLVGVAATVILRESLVDPLPAAGLFEWVIVGGATATTNQPVEPGSVGCDLIDDDVTAVEEFSGGAEQRGIVCFLVPLADFEHPETRVVLTAGDGAPATWIR